MKNFVKVLFLGVVVFAAIFFTVMSSVTGFNLLGWIGSQIFEAILICLFLVAGFWPVLLVASVLGGKK